MAVPAGPPRQELASHHPCQRTELLRLLSESPSLKPGLRRDLAELYGLAIDRAIGETDLPDAIFLPACPFSLDQILDQDFFPE